jgi:hypothetical protein
MSDETKASEPKAKKTKAVKSEAKKESKPNQATQWEGKSVSELKITMQKIILDLRTGKEKNTSLVRKLRRQIARELTKNK